MTVRILLGDVRDRLRDLPDESVHCVVTSPPYWGLRDYGVEGQLGVEPTLTQHLSAMTDVFREVRRVLRKDGTLWLNYGDCYSTSSNGRSAADTKAAGKDDRTFRDKPFSTTTASGLPAGNMCLVPERLAIALQEDGWFVRSRIVWGKRNTKPDSSGRFRPSYNHEMIWMLSKRSSCFYDSFAVRQPTASSTKGRLAQDVENQVGSFRQPGKTNGPFKAVGSAATRLLRAYEEAPAEVWPMATAAFRGAHTATFPPELVERCLRAGTSAGGVCPKCRAPYLRLVEDGEPLTEWQRSCGGDATGDYRGQAVKDYESTGAQNASDLKRRVLKGMVEKVHAGWKPGCDCNAGAPTRPLVLDPFGGAGTTGLVAEQRGCDSVLIELNADYAKGAAERIGPSAYIETSALAAMLA